MKKLFIRKKIGNESRNFNSETKKRHEAHLSILKLYHLLIVAAFNMPHARSICSAFKQVRTEGKGKKTLSDTFLVAVRSI